MKDAKEYFKTVAKADIHNHFHLGSSQDRFLNAYPKSKIIFPDKYDGLEGMIDFIYGMLNKVMLTRYDVIKFMEMSILSSIKDNVSYLEASVDVNLVQYFDDSIDDVLNTVKELKEKYSSQIEFRPDIGINKDLPIEKAYRLGEAFMDSGVFHGIDLYGQEANKDLYPFKELFYLAKRKSLITKVHIGEFSNANTIGETINLLDPDELQHGINAVSSDSVLDLILEKDIQMNICPTSNVSLGAVKYLNIHPIKVLFDKGIRVTVNTDDLVLFNATVSDELNALLGSNLFSFDEVEIIRKNGFRT